MLINAILKFKKKIWNMENFRSCQHHTKHLVFQSIRGWIPLPHQPNDPSQQNPAYKERPVKINIWASVCYQQWFSSEKRLLKIQTIREISMCWFSPFFLQAESNHKEHTCTVCARVWFRELWVHKSQLLTPATGDIFSDCPSTWVQWNDTHIPWATL